MGPPLLSRFRLSRSPSTNPLYRIFCTRLERVSSSLLSKVLIYDNETMSALRCILTTFELSFKLLPKRLSLESRAVPYKLYSTLILM